MWVIIDITADANDMVAVAGRETTYLLTGADLKAALDAVLEGRQVSAEQKPSMGCNIKWEQGNEPEYAK